MFPKKIICCEGKSSLKNDFFFNKHKILNNIQINEQINDTHQLCDHVNTAGS